VFRWVKELHEQRIEWVVTGTGATLLLAFLAVLAVVGGMAAGKNAAGDAILWSSMFFFVGALIDVIVTTIHDRYVGRSR